MTTATQREMILPRTTVRAPLIPLAAFAAIRGLSPAEILGCIEMDRAIVGTDHLAWAWDISTSAADRRREIRVLSCLLTEPNRLADYTLAEVLDIIFPVRRHAGRHPAIAPNFILGTELAAAWTCDNDHILALCADKSLRTLPNTTIRPGPGGCPVIQWASIVEFLKARKI